MRTEASGRPNLAAVAALAGVSRSTASLAFSGAGPVSEATRAKVLAAADQLGYAGPDPRAQSLRRGRSGIIGVVIEDRLRDAFVDPIMIAMLDGIADVAGTAGAGLLLLTDTGADRIDISSAPMDAVILVGCSTRLDESVDVLRQRGMPIVAIEADVQSDVYSVGLDNRDATATLARLLKSQGHERVAVVTLPIEDSKGEHELPPDWETVSTSHTSLERLRGLRDIYPGFTGRVASGSTIDSGRTAGLAVLASVPRPTAVVAQSDLLAIGVIRAAEELGLDVPADLSVVGFDGIRIDEARPYDLTTIVQPAVAKGRAAAQAAIDMLEGAPAGRIDFESELHVGGTVGPA
ncbi:substrate-binding domain-containing protein [soil metagenome]